MTQKFRPAWFQFVSFHFRHPTKGAALRPRDFGAIEHAIRQGKKMLEQYEISSIKNVSMPVSDQGPSQWPLGWVAKGGKDRLR